MKPISRRTPANLVNGYALNDEVGFWSVVVPKATTNLFLNPSFETSVADWSILSGSMTVSQGANGYAGISCLQLSFSGSATARGAQIGVSPNTIYTFSCYVKETGMSPSNSPTVSVRYLDAGSALISSVSAPIQTDPNIWQRVVTTFTTPATAAFIDIAVSYGATGGTALVDGLQLEALPYATTYVDGTQPGCYWLGAKHASPSARLASEPTGGRVFNFRDFSFAVMATIAAGAPALTTVDSPYVFGGGFYQLSTPNIRQFTISGVFEAESLISLKRAKQQLLDVIKPYRNGGSDPVRLLYQPYRCRNPLAETIAVDCVYTGGLEGAEDNEVQQRSAITFRTYLPAVMGTRVSGSSVQLNLQTDFDFGFAMTGLAVQDRINGGWSRNNFTYSFAPTRAYPDGKGNILSTSPGGNRLIRYNSNGTNDVMGTGGAPGINGDINDIAVDSVGDIYAVGAFTNIGSVTGANRIAKYSSGVWSSLGTNSLNGTAYCMAFGPDGKLYVGGAFTTANNGALSVPYGIAIWTGSAWAAPVMGPYAFTTGTVRAIMVTRDNTLWWSADIGGGQYRIRALNLATGAYVLAPPGLLATKVSGSATVTAFAEGLDGKVYIGGDFDNYEAPIRPGYGLMVWSGTGLPTPLPGLTASLNVKRLIVDKAGLLHIQAGVGSAAGLYFTNGGDSYIQWNGSAFTRIGALLRGTIVVSDLQRGFVGTDNNPVSQITVVNNGGGTRVYPTFIVKAVQNSNLVLLRNHTTKKEVQFNQSFQYTADTLTVTFKPDFTVKLGNGSDASGNILGGSDTDFYLAPGPNLIEVFIQPLVATASQAYLQWYDAFDTIDGAVR